MKSQQSPTPHGAKKDERFAIPQVELSPGRGAAGAPESTSTQPGKRGECVGGGCLYAATAKKKWTPRTERAGTDDFERPFPKSWR